MIPLHTNDNIRSRKFRQIESERKNRDAPIVGYSLFHVVEKITRFDAVVFLPFHIKQARDSPWRESSSVKGQDNLAICDTMVHHSITLNTVELGSEHHQRNDAKCTEITQTLCRGIIWCHSGLYPVAQVSDRVRISDDSAEFATKDRFLNPCHDRLERPLLQSDKDESDL